REMRRVCRRVMPDTGSKAGSRHRPESITTRTPSMVRLVSAMGVANTTLRRPGGAGTLMVRGPWTVERYFRSDTSALDAEGWFDTGDIATLDENGFMRITDRT